MATKRTVTHISAAKPDAVQATDQEGALGPDVAPSHLDLIRMKREKLRLKDKMAQLDRYGEILPAEDYENRTRVRAQPITGRLDLLAIQQAVRKVMQRD